MFHIALCDDEHVFSKQVSELLARYAVQDGLEAEFDFELRCFGSAQELLATDYIYDILFLDIMLGGEKDGIETGIELRRRGVDAIFILLSSMERFQDGYRANVLRYLRKPLDPVDFFEAMDAAVREFHIPRKRFGIKTKSGSVYVSLSDIIMVDIYYRKRMVYTTKGDYSTTEGWEEICARLNGASFYRPRKTVIINFEHVRESGSSGILMDNGKRLNFSRNIKNNYAMFSKVFQKYLGG